MNTQTLDVLTSSGSENWATPQYFVDRLEKYFGPFDLDAAASLENHKAPRFYTEERDGLKQPWFGTVFCNPPFNRSKKMYVRPWIRKAVDETGYLTNALRVVMLVPARTDTKFWHEEVMRYAETVLFVEGRLRFEQDGKRNSAPFPSAVVIFSQAFQFGASPRFGTIEGKPPVA